MAVPGQNRSRGKYREKSRWLIRIDPIRAAVELQGKEEISITPLIHIDMTRSSRSANYTIGLFTTTEAMLCISSAVFLKIPYEFISCANSEFAVFLAIFSLCLTLISILYSKLIIISEWWHVNYLVGPLWSLLGIQQNYWWKVIEIENSPKWTLNLS